MNNQAANAIKKANQGLAVSTGNAAVNFTNRVTTAVVASPNANAFAKNIRNAKNSYVSEMTKAHQTYINKVATAKLKLES
jgi:hypothetical protein